MKVFICVAVTGRYSDTHFQITRVYKDKEPADAHVTELNKCSEEIDAAWKEINERSYFNIEDREAVWREGDRRTAEICKRYKHLLVENQNQIDEGLFAYVEEKEIEEE